MSELIIQSGKLQGKKLVLPAKEMLVGRDEDCDMKIASSLVSRKHCSLQSTKDGIVVKDLGSQNGTLVNEVPITEPTLLKEGDILRIGAIVMVVPTQPKPKSVSGNAPPQSPTKISEADVADWLMDAGSNYGSGDTAEIATFAPQSPTPLPPTAPAPKLAPSKAMSVKDEAAAVIRKHWETVKSRQKE